MRRDKKTKYLIFLAFTGFLTVNLLQGQAPSAILDLESTTQGLILPRMDSTQRNLMENPVPGMIIFNTSTNQINCYNALDWDIIPTRSNYLPIINLFRQTSEGIQILLDAGESPANILKAGADTSQFLGLNYEGGLIFYLRSDGTGLVAAPETQDTLAEWGCFGTNITGLPDVPSAPPSGPGADIGEGVVNTGIIVAADCMTSSGMDPGAKFCSDYLGGGYSDWFLPSVNELVEMYNVLHLNGKGGFAADFYWSSSELSGDHAWIQKFNSSLSFNFDNKNSVHGVRAIRAF